MSWPGSRRIAAITLAFICIVILVASAIIRTSALDGPAGFVFFLLVVVSPFLIAIGIGISVWRLMTQVLPCWIGAPERLLFAFASFVLVFGCGPLAISSAVMLIAHVEGSVGASGIWALLGILFSGLFCVLAGVIAVGRTVFDWMQNRRGGAKARDC